jgi:hypothetical protein
MWAESGAPTKPSLGKLAFCQDQASAVPIGPYFEGRVWRGLTHSTAAANLTQQLARVEDAFSFKFQLDSFHGCNLWGHVFPEKCCQDAHVPL